MIAFTSVRLSFVEPCINPRCSFYLAGIRERGGKKGMKFQPKRNGNRNQTKTRQDRTKTKTCALPFTSLSTHTGEVMGKKIIQVLPTLLFLSFQSPREGRIVSFQCIVYRDSHDWSNRPAKKRTRTRFQPGTAPSPTKPTDQPTKIYHQRCRKISTDKRMRPDKGAMH